ncbi:hypothetical protein LTR53_004343 [Teratosphaeriaceae sp. CCFEE 6253]|nr:hypothetical protein LTR53_004343 [Teratosphaeriaceae sp. CCFEE 6253]
MITADDGQGISTTSILVVPAWLLRPLRGDSSWKRDLGLFLCVNAAYGYLVGHWHMPGWRDLQRLDPKDEVKRLYMQIFALLAMCSIFAGGIVFRGRRLHTEEIDEPIHSQRIDEQVLPPLLLPSRTTHSRMFPKKHAFSYSYLFVGIPVGITGRLSKMLSVDSPQAAWFHIDSADYLERGNADWTLAEKLKAYLHTQGVTDRDYAFAYLVTAPRFLGYSFNPVSFWYLYDADTTLKCMILEVNNTFDERRLYLLKGGSSDDEVAGEHFDVPVNGANDASKHLVFSDSWSKDFHVSPFNSRKGSYSLRAMDPFADYERSGCVRIDNTIVLRSSKEHPKLVARVFSDGEAKDPAGLSLYEGTTFILRWCWVGFATFPRIAWQAAKLSLRRKLHVWYRPEVTDSSISRPYTDDERRLEGFFRDFLTDFVHAAPAPLRVIYKPARSEGAEVVLYSPAFTYEEDHGRTVTLELLSPAFYSRMVHYSDLDTALNRECCPHDMKNRTARIEELALLPKPRTKRYEATIPATAERNLSASFSMLEQVRWACMRRLRCPPAKYAYPESASNGLNILAVTHPAASEMDEFIRAQCSDADVYRRIATKLFLAQRFSFGVPGLLDALDLLFRSALLLASMIYCDHAQAPIDILRPRQLELGDVRIGVVMLALANSVHIWSFLKG